MAIGQYTDDQRQADAVDAALNQRFDRVEQLAEQFNVPQGRRKLVGKARKNVVNMVATIAYFWHMFSLKEMEKGSGMDR